MIKSNVFPALSQLGRLAHWVDNSAFGQVLVVDTAIAGGRAAAALKRSVYESIENLFRDIFTNFFYILAIPWTMALVGRKLISGVLGRFTHAHTDIDPQVALKVHRAIERRLPINDSIKPAQLQRILFGAPSSEITPIVETLLERFAKIGPETGMGVDYFDWLRLFRNELQSVFVFQGNPELSEILANRVENELISQRKNKTGHFTMAELETLLHRAYQKDFLIATVEKGKETVHRREALFYLNQALKFSFHHHAGISWDKLSPHLQGVPESVTRRLHSYAQQNRDALITSLLRRTALLKSTKAAPSPHSMESALLFLEHGMMQAKSFDQLMPATLRQALEDLQQAKVDNTLVNQLQQKLANEHAHISTDELTALADLLKQKR